MVVWTRHEPSHCRLTSPRQEGNPHEYLYNPHIARNYRASGLYLWRWQYGFIITDSTGLSSFKFMWWAPKTHVLCNGVCNGHSRSSTVVDFGINWKRVCDFLLVITSNLDPILPRFRDIAGFLLKTATPTLFHPNLGDVPLGLDRRRLGSEQRRPELIRLSV